MTKTEEYLNKPVAIRDELLKLFNTSDNLIILDVGSCEGLDSIRYAKLFPNATIYAFEPLPDNAIKIESNIAKYGGHNIKVVQEALSDQKGMVSFFVSSGHPDHLEKSEDWDYGNKSSSLLPPDKSGKEIHKWLKFERQIQVPANTLENFCNQHKIDAIDFIHMDVQGAELMVLKGAKDYLKNIKMIWMEVEKVALYKGQPLKDEVEKYMKENGFVKIIDAVGEVSGDQLYVSAKYKQKVMEKDNLDFGDKLKKNIRAILGNKSSKKQELKSVNDLNKYIKNYEDWIRFGRFLPPPHMIKQQIIKEYRDEFKLQCLVETGTFKGDMVEACKELFSKIYSIELSKTLYEAAVNRFSNYKHISIHHGDSAEVLQSILPNISEPTLFWLDGHYSAGITAKGSLNTPIMSELTFIFDNSSSLDSHVILIDDARCFTGENDYPTLFEIYEFIKKFDNQLFINVKDDIIRIHK